MAAPGNFWTTSLRSSRDPHFELKMVELRTKFVRYLNNKKVCCSICFGGQAAHASLASLPWTCLHSALKICFLV